MSDLLKVNCQPIPKGTAPLKHDEIQELMAQIEGWDLTADLQAIHREFKFKNFYETMAFVNAVAWIANRQDHHPDLQVSYNRCFVHFSTHSVGGLSLNDFICAAHIDAIL